MDELLKGAAAQLFKTYGLAGLAIVVLAAVVVVLWRDNLRLRSVIEAGYEAREKRDDARFGEVKTIAEQSTAAAAKASAAALAMGAALSHTNELVEKQGDLIEARTAAFATNASTLLLVDASFKALKEAVDALSRRIEQR